MNPLTNQISPSVAYRAENKNSLVHVRSVESSVFNKVNTMKLTVVCAFVALSFALVSVEGKGECEGKRISSAFSTLDDSFSLFGHSVRQFSNEVHGTHGQGRL